MSETIPGYVGQVQVAAIGDDIGEGIIIPCSLLDWEGALEIDALTVASGGPYPNVTPGFNKPGLLEFMGPWRQDFNPFASTPIFQLGQTMQIQFSIWPSNIDAYAAQAFVAFLKFHTETDKRPWWHMLLVAVWKFEGPLAATLVRDIGGDNNAGSTGF